MLFTPSGCMRITPYGAVSVGPGTLGRVYRQRASVIDGAVVWHTTATGPGQVLPDGCMDLIWMDGEVVVAGPDTRPT